MRSGMIAGLVAVCVGVGAFAILNKNTPVPPTPAVVSSTGDNTPATPVVTGPPALLPEVVIVADLDPLLDPPARLDTGLTFDPEAPPVNSASSSKPARPAPDRIPLARD